MSEEERDKKWQRDYRIRTLLLIIALFLMWAGLFLWGRMETKKATSLEKIEQNQQKIIEMLEERK